MSHDNDISNRSGNRPFEDILNTQISRRKVLAGGLATATTTFFAGFGTAQAHGGNNPFAKFHHDHHHPKRKLINFEPVPVADGNGPVPTISKDYQYQVLIPWGEPIEPGGPAYQWPPTAADQAQQIGIGHDGMTYFPMKHGKFKRGGNGQGMLAINHEFGRNSHVLGKDFPENLQDVRTSQHAHGVAVVEIRKHKDDQWKTVRSKNARRIHVNTPVAFSGPVAGHELLQTLERQYSTWHRKQLLQRRNPMGYLPDLRREFQWLLWCQWPLGCQCRTGSIWLCRKWIWLWLARVRSPL